MTFLPVSGCILLLICPLYGHATFLLSLVKSSLYYASFVCQMYLRRCQSLFSSPAAIQSPRQDHSPLVDLVIVGIFWITLFGNALAHLLFSANPHCSEPLSWFVNSVSSDVVLSGFIQAVATMFLRFFKTYQKTHFQ